MSRRGSKRAFSPQFERDYTFYLSNKDTFTFAGTNVKRDYGIQFPGEPEPIEKDDDGNDQVVPFSIPYSPTGKSAKVCFYQLDSEGKCKTCSEPELLMEILRCKSSINLQIKIWAQSRAEWTLAKFELQEYMEFYKAPDWVFKAIENQKLKILKEWAAEKKYESDYYKRIFELHMGEFLEEMAGENQGSGVILDPNKID
jgi:hypothetical protein